MGTITIQEALAQCARLDTDTAQLDTEVLLCHVLNKARSYLRTWPEATLSDSEQTYFEDLLLRRINGEPVAYLTGSQSFWTLELKVSPQTLIPRADTELLVECALVADLPSDARVLDLGTGTGAIALALGFERQQWSVMGVDCADEVVALACQNARQNGLERVSFITSDWFANVEDDAFDLIVSNPPYIDPDDVHLDQGDVRYEPTRALVSANKGLADLQHIAREASRRLTQGGWLMVEHGYDQGRAVRGLFEAAGLTRIETFRDLGDQERVTRGQLVERYNGQRGYEAE